MSKENGGAAFPQTQQVGQISVTEGGMTLRDYFAAKAMQGICAHTDSWGPDSLQKIAQEAYELSDAMLAAREVQK